MTKAGVVFVVLIVAITVKFRVSAEFTGPPGTDRDLEAIFKGRCAEYRTGRVNPHVQAAELKTKNCTLLWELFYNAFVYRDACNVTMEDYKEFVEEAAVEIPANRAVYWDGWDVYPVARSYANEARRASTLEFMMMGYMINGLVFCGQTEDPGINYEVCPGTDECDFAKGSVDAFWAAASIYFGSNGNGNVKFMVNSNRPGGAFQLENSYFAEFELKNMNSSKVSRVDIYIVTLIGEEPGDNCDSQSIKTLKSKLTERGINYRCVDQPDEVLHILCADNPTTDACAFSSSAVRLHPSNKIQLAALPFIYAAMFKSFQV
ncbi:ADP-ribosyl cyclase/cyclic ADP-ribose hydrolase-like [Patiria miniata]|uniref:ADP-ribosyl cyclase/cyclic ADP-ribose hydrolase n=1 Tax=Patiria miniata TaxID=46514 RepID=A0A913ZFW7_PATMI|nr:ADP-ribosyl cyclase/cyclic ADP-ribose hydrolase-like [Patiria miniata]